jgi:O-antigen/teichoic acid export membrane protein
VIQRTILIKRIDFKMQTKISVAANVLAGGTAIIMAYRGFGVWSLVAQQVIFHAMESVLFWLGNRWLPRSGFSKTSFRELFDFGYKLLLSGLLNSVFKQANNIVIGKYFSAAQLGFYTKAHQFSRVPSQNLNGIIQRVSYPVLSEMQDNPERLKHNYVKLIRATMLLTFTAMLGLAAVAKPLILTLLGEKWSQSIIYLQLLCFVGIFQPLHSLNLSMLKVQGLSGKLLKLAVYKKTIAVPLIIIGVILGIKWLIIGMILRQIVAYFLNSAYSGKLIGYSSFQQIKDILPSFLLAVGMGAAVYFLGQFLNFYPAINLVIQIFAVTVLVLLLSELFRFKDYTYLKEIILQQIIRSKRGNN